MAESIDDDKLRLFSIDTKLRLEADQLLEQSGIGEILLNEGFKPSGSYIMKTMIWRDLDFERIDANPNREQHWALGQKLARTGWIWGFRCIDAYKAHDIDDEGLYWGLQVANPLGGDTWKIDLWTLRFEELCRGSPKRDLWDSKLTEDSRYKILAIKEVLWNLPNYRKNLQSVHIYEAVLENNISTIDEFWDWWKKRYLQ